MKVIESATGQVLSKEVDEIQATEFMILDS